MLKTRDIDSYIVGPDLLKETLPARTLVYLFKTPSKAVKFFHGECEKYFGMKFEIQDGNHIFVEVKDQEYGIQFINHYDEFFTKDQGFCLSVVIGDLSEIADCPVVEFYEVVEKEEIEFMKDPY